MTLFDSIRSAVGAMIRRTLTYIELEREIDYLTDDLQFLSNELQEARAKIEQLEGDLYLKCPCGK